MVHYSPLDPEKGEIRLVTLLPGKHRDEIRCNLSTASLYSEPTPRFAALSYAWGDLSDTRSITINSEPFHVTVNLEAGLRAIRKRWKSRVLWIDAICINQTDIQERNVQVPQMGRLYSSAPTVLVWLGPSTPDIKLAISWLRGHIPKTYNTAVAYWLVLNMMAAVSKRAQRYKDISLLRAAEGFIDFLSLPYWGRMWTYQEYRLSRDKPICVCGNLKPFQMIGGFMEPGQLELLSRLSREAAKRLAVGSGTTSGEESVNLIENNTDLPHRLLSPPSLTAFTVLGLLNVARNGDNEEPLPTLLFSTANRQCSDEHDRMYALYGMVPAALTFCPPNYKSPIRDVMLQVVRFMVNVEQSTSLIWAFFGLRDDRISDETRSYPSWMPDFTKTMLHQQSTATIHASVELRVATALAPLEGPRVARVVLTTLQFRARSLGTCKIILQFANTRCRVHEQMTGLLHRDMVGDFLLSELVGRDKTRNSVSEGVQRRRQRRAIARICVAHSPSFETMSTEEILKPFNAIVNSGPNAIPDHSHDDPWSPIGRVVDGLRGKVLLVTEDRRFGVSVGGAKDGDLVVIPPELAVPVVLTRNLAYSTRPDSCYEMVGTAIIDGVMSGAGGELFDGKFVEKVAQQELLEFHVR